MTGEIFGRIAGLGCVELVLFLFLFVRVVFASVFLLFMDVKAGLVGELSALISGLGLPCSAAAAEGELIGACFATFLEDMRLDPSGA
jgi:hypothetical protein